MRSRMTHALLIAVVVLLGADLALQLRPVSPARAASTEPVAEVVRAKLIELVASDGRVVGQLHTGEDGSANLRLRSGSGEVRVKLGASRDGAGLVLMDGNTEPAVSLAAQPQATSITLAEPGKPKRVIAP